MFGLLNDHLDGGFLSFWWVFIFAEEAFDFGAHGGAIGGFELPVNGAAAAEYCIRFIGSFFKYFSEHSYHTSITYARNLHRSVYLSNSIFSINSLMNNFLSV